MDFDIIILKMSEYIDKMSEEELQRTISDIFDKEEIETPFGVITLYKRKLQKDGI